MMKYFFIALALLLGAGAAHACNVPNPNLTALPPNIKDGCPLPAVLSNRFVAVSNPTPTGGQVNFGTGLVNSAYWGSAYAVGAAVSGNNQGLIGQVSNNLPSNTTALPVGTIGYGFLPVGSNGNIVFGLYGLGELYATLGGVAVGGEVTSRNFSGNNPDTSLPPLSTFGTTTSVVNGWQVTCGSLVVGEKDCSIGVFIANEGGLTNPVYNTGEYIQLYRQYGLFIDAMASGTQTGAVIKNNGNGINLQLSTTGAITPGNGVISVLDNGTALHFGVKQSGEIDSTGKLEFSQTARPTLGSNCNGAGSSINKSTDQAGFVTTPTAGATGGLCTVNFTPNTGAAFVNTPSCIVGLEGASGAFISAHSATAITIGGLSSSASQTVDYHCIDQN